MFIHAIIYNMIRYICGPIIHFFDGRSPIYSGQIFALFILCKEAKKISNSLQKQTKKAKKILLIEINK